MYERLHSCCQLFPLPSQLFLFWSEPGWLPYLKFVIDRLLSLHEFIFTTVTCMPLNVAFIANQAGTGEGKQARFLENKPLWVLVEV